MTRINVVPPTELCDQHLLAEWRELPRMASFAFKARCGVEDVPPVYVLGAGHMTFFLDKGIFLERRHQELTAELHRRGFNLQPREPFTMPGTFGRKDYVPTAEALALNRARIASRMPERVRWSKPV